MFILLGCKNSYESENDKFLSEYLKTWPSLGEQNKEEYHSRYLFFICLSNDKVMICNSRDLNWFFKRNYEEKYDYKTFLKKLYVDKIKIDTTMLSGDLFTTFAINYEIQSSDIDLLLNKYCVKHERGLYGLFLKDNRNVKYNILYKFFNNRFYINIDDVVGEYIISKD